MANRNKIIKEISQLYVGISFYYSDFLSLKETIYNNNLGLKESYYSRIRVIEKNTLGQYISNVPIHDFKEKLEITTLNSRVASIFPDKKSRVHYPYIHKITRNIDALSSKNIKKTEQIIKNYKRKYKPDFFDFTIKYISKLILSNAGTIINQDFMTVKFTIKFNNRIIFRHYKINNIKDIKFPPIGAGLCVCPKDGNKDGNTDLILSPMLVAKMALYFFERNINIKTLELFIAPYLYKGVQSNLYDDEGTVRVKSKYKALSGGSILNNKDNSSGYFYNFDKNKFVLKQPDLEIKSGNKSSQDFDKDEYFLLNDYSSINVSNGKVIINSDLSLFSKGINQGYFNKKIVIPIGELEKIDNLTKNTKVIGFESSSIKAPYFYIGKNYE